MSDGTETPDGGADEPSAVETEARQLGWVPQEEFRGDPEKWVDAESFVKRGKEQLPILLENNRRLKAEVQRQAGELKKMKSLVDANQETINELREFNKEVFEARVAAEKDKWKAAIKQAREEGDVDKELEARENLDEVTDKARKAAEAAKEKKETQPEPEPQGDATETPEFIAWKSANPWFSTDQRKAALAHGLAVQVRNENPTAVGKEFYDLLDQAIAEEMPHLKKKITPTSKVDKGGRPSGGGGEPKAGTYEALPADAKAQADKDARKFVGPGRAFKNEAEWRAHYAKLYFAQEPA